MCVTFSLIDMKARPLGRGCVCTVWTLCVWDFGSIPGSVLGAADTALSLYDSQVHGRGKQVQPNTPWEVI